LLAELLDEAGSDQAEDLAALQERRETTAEAAEAALAGEVPTERTDQVASPPLLRLDSRYVVDFEGGPPGRYPYLLEGSGAAGRGVVVVEVGN
jgi:hypothetical protein